MGGRDGVWTPTNKKYDRRVLLFWWVACGVACIAVWALAIALVSGLLTSQ
jgi:hypothetical protein